MVSARPLMKDRAFEHIKGLILDGTYQPGQFISERELSIHLAMSKTPVRAALERLEEQGFVTIAPQRGVIVRTLTAQEIADHYDLRMALESWIARQVAGRLSDAQLTALKENLSLQRAQVGGATIDVRGFMSADAEFHQLLTQATGNVEFERVLQRHWDKVERLVESIASRDNAVLAHSCAEHQAIFDALQSGDGNRAAALVIAHLEHGKRFMLLGGAYGE